MANSKSKQKRKHMKLVQGERARRKRQKLAAKAARRAR